MNLTNIEGWEHGVISANGYSIVQAFDAWTGTTGCRISAAIKRTGSYSCEVKTAGGTATFNINPAATPTVLVDSFYFYFSGSLPNADAIFWRATGTNCDARIYFESADGKLYLAWGTTRGNGTAALVADTWYRLDIKVDVSANPHTFDIQLDAVAVAQHTEAVAAGTVTAVTYGTVSNCTMDAFFDDILRSETAGDYPIGAHAVEVLVPTSDGTHDAGVNTMEDQTGADIGVVTAYDLLDEIPPDTTAYIRQSIGDGASYAEVNFGDTANTNILGANAIVAVHASGTNPNNIKAYIIDAAAQSTTLFNTSTETFGTALQYRGGIITPPVAGWSLTTVNGLKGRVGFSSDVDSIPYWDGFYVQVAYAPAGLSPIGPSGGIASAEAHGTGKMRGTIQSEV